MIGIVLIVLKKGAFFCWVKNLLCEGLADCFEFFEGGAPFFVG